MRVVRDYAFALGVLDDYDHGRIPQPAVAAEAPEPISLEEALWGRGTLLIAFLLMDRPKDLEESR